MVRVVTRVTTGAVTKATTGNKTVTRYNRFKNIIKRIKTR